MTALDRRVNAYRPDLADARLRGRIEAGRFSDGDLYEIVVSEAPVRREPRPDATMLTEALFGERVRVFEIDDEGWAWGQLESDGYVGFIPAAALTGAVSTPTHKVVTPRTHGFPGADIKLPPFVALPLGSRIEIAGADGTFARTPAGIHVPARHLAPVGSYLPDFVAVAERLAGTPYLWGGKTTGGIDCSGLVQVSLQACGIACPRDSDMQEAALGNTVALSDIRRGDLVFWKGHVAIARDESAIVHANATHMMVAVEPIADAIARIEKAGQRVTSVKRLAP